MSNKFFAMIACCLLGLAVLLTGCGSGGGNSGSDTPQQDESLDTFNMQGLAFDAESQPGLEIQWTQNGTLLGTFRLNPNPENSSAFTGTIDPQTRQITIDAGTGVDIYDLNESLVFDRDRFRIQVDEAVVIPSGANPSSGVILLQALDMTPFTIRITLGGTNGDLYIEYDMDGTALLRTPIRGTGTLPTILPTPNNTWHIQASRRVFSC